MSYLKGCMYLIHPKELEVVSDVSLHMSQILIDVLLEMYLFNGDFMCIVIPGILR